MDQLKLKDINFMTRKKSLATNTRARKNDQQNHVCLGRLDEKSSYLITALFGVVNFSLIVER